MVSVSQMRHAQYKNDAYKFNGLSLSARFLGSPMQAPENRGSRERKAMLPPEFSTETEDNPSPAWEDAAMDKTPTAMIAGFTAAERDYIRRELDMFFSTLPSVAEGFQIRTWRGGPHAGKPKIPQAAQGLLDRGLMRLDLDGRLPMLFFTAAGITALRTMIADARLADPKKFAHVRQEVGIDPCPGAKAAE